MQILLLVRVLCYCKCSWCCVLHVVSAHFVLHVCCVVVSVCHVASAFCVATSACCVVGVHRVVIGVHCGHCVVNVHYVIEGVHHVPNYWFLN